MKKEILQKYSIPVPRYTSYPPANFFSESFTADDYKRVVVQSNEQNPQHISIYIHIPFCFQMCYYCGCNALLLKNKNQVADYMAALKKEIGMVLPLLDKTRLISQIHYGGGTPTSQPVAMLKELNQLFLSQFECIPNPEIAIECHPGYLNEQYCLDLIDAGFNRISLGVQDFDSDVLKTSNRKAPRMPIGDIIALFRERSIPINMDFIYGLPKQSVERFSQTIEQAIALRPDRVVTFSYAHVPWVNDLQKKLEEAGLPDVQTKSDIYQAAKQLLTDAGYMTIGLDHFVLPNDELYKAEQSKALHRNFQGYCTRRTTGQVYAFGTTGISQLSTAYSQNVKDVDTYIAEVEKGNFPIVKGYELSAEQQIAREAIAQLMCNYAIRWDSICHDLAISKTQLIAALNYNDAVLAEFAKDGIITYDDNHITVLPHAAPFVRNVAASLDKMLIDSQGRYSKSL